MSDAYESYQFSLKNGAELEQPRGNSRNGSHSSTTLNRHDPDAIEVANLSIALIGPDQERRKTLVKNLAGLRGGEVREFSSYPPTIDNVAKMLDRSYDVVIIDLDSDLEYALELVESICAEESATVMVYSANADQELVFRCMRAGAREFLFPPFDQAAIVDALARSATAPRPGSRRTKKTRGRLLPFLGVKGGSGVTTIACNFAIALGQESGQSTLLIDLGLPLGDAALNLGIITEFSTDHAFQDVSRLDATFLSKLLVKHRSGISVLAAPSKVPKVQASNEAIDKLMNAARGEFENVIVDVGSRLDLMDTSLFKEASSIYLVAQAGISELRNSNRVITQFFNLESPKLEVVINRFDSNALGLTDEHITKALNRPVQWKVPDDYAAARQMQNSTSPSTLADSTISRLIRQMARASCGLPAIPEKPTGFRLRGLGKNNSNSGKIPIIEEQAAATSTATATIDWPAPATIAYGTKLNAAQLNATASALGTFVYTPAAGYMLPAGTHTLWVTFTAMEGNGAAPVQAAASITVSKASPVVSWPTPQVVSCGSALSSKHLTATAPVPGRFVYTPAAGEVLSAGKHKLSVTFTPTDAANYTTAEAVVLVTVAKATPAVSWTAPAPISCGAALSDSQLNASASVPGTFVYTPAAGDRLSVGRHTLSVTFHPADDAGFNEATATVVLSVTRSAPTIAWPTPASIVYGTRLSAAHLDATASVPGTFAYTPSEGAVLTAGDHTPFVTFTPKDTASYTTAQAAVTLTVHKADPVVTWETASSISDGAPLTSTQLNATASVPGTFIYKPAAGQALPAGRHMLSVTFTPMDTENLNIVQATMSINVTKAMPATIKWESPASISYGTPLSSTQLNATSPIVGTFTYSPAAGDVLTPGRHKLHVTLTPQDDTKYATAQFMEVIEVQAVPNLDSLLKASTRKPFMVTESTATETSDETGLEEANEEVFAMASAPSKNYEPQTRTYKGAIYEKGEDGQWHLQRK
jgi:Flp pilus assembly CpaE family ATPase